MSMKKKTAAVGAVLFLFGLLLFCMAGNIDGRKGQTDVLSEKTMTKKGASGNGFHKREIGGKRCGRG